MLKKILATVLACILSIVTCFAQTAPDPQMTARAKLTRADFLEMETAKPYFEKELYKSQKRQNKLSSGQKTALWLGLFVAGVVTVVILATTLDGDDDRNPCGGGGILTPCPPGCVCTQ